MDAPHPLTLRGWPRAGCTLSALLVIGMMVVPGKHGWAQDTKAAQGTLKGLSGVGVWVGDLAPDITQRGVTTQQLQTEVERQVRRAGIRVFSGQDAATPADMAFVCVSHTPRGN